MNYKQQQPEQTWGQAGQEAVSSGLEMLTMLGIPQQKMFSAMLSDSDAAAARKKNKGFIGFRDILRANNIVDEEDNWGNFALGLGGDLLFDPLNALGIGGLSKAGKLLSKTKSLKQVPGILAQGVARKIPGISDDVTSAVTRRASKMKMPGGGKYDLGKASVAELTGNAPLYGGAANRYGTIRQIERAKKAGIDVPYWNAIEQRLNKLSPAARERILDQPLQYDFGIGIPGIPPWLSTTSKTPGANILGNLLSGAGEKISTGFKYGHGTNKLYGKFARTFDSKVGQADDVASQGLIKGVNNAIDQGKAAGRRRAGQHLAPLTAPNIKGSIFDDMGIGGRAMAEAIEEPEDILKMVDGKKVVVPMSSADSYLKKLPTDAAKAIDDVAKWFKKEGADFLQESAEAGVKSDKLDDPFVDGYLPRVIPGNVRDKFNDSAVIKNSLKGPTELNTMTADMMMRAPGTKVPGGRNTLIELTSDPYLVGSKRTAATDADATKYIEDILYPSGVSGDAKVRTKELTDILRRLPDLDEMKAPLYGNSPAESILEYAGGRGGAIGGGRAKIDQLASKAVGNAGEVPVSAGNVQRSMTFDKAMASAGLESTTASRETFRKRLAVYSPELANRSLDDLFIPESAIAPLMQTAQTYEKSQGLFSKIQAIWRNSILTWPARYTRDKIGGMMVNFYEGMLGYFGERGSTLLISYGAYDPRTQKFIQAIPQYAHLAADEASATFIADLLSTGMTVNTRRLDLGIAGENIKSIIPGAAATGKGSTRQAAENVGQAAMNIGGILQTEGKYAEAGAKAGEIIDQSNRLSAYMQLMGKQDYTAEAAAQKVLQSHVDYSSLTDKEKYFRDNYVPFYTFASRMFGEQVARIIRDPARMKRSLTALTAGERGEEPGTVAPDYVRDRFGTELSPGSGNFLYGLDIPGMEQQGLINALAKSVTGDVGGMNDAAGRLIGNLGPAPKSFAEFVTGTQQFSGRDMNNYRGDVSKLTGAEPSTMLGKRLLQGLDKAVEFSPISRVVSNARMLKQGMTQGKMSKPAAIGNSLLSATTGFKVVPVSPIDQVNNKLRNQLDTLKGIAPDLRSFEQPYITSEALEELRTTDPRQAREYDTYKQLQKARSRIYEEQDAGRLPRGMRNRN
jgi:hypothetical protein